MSSSSWVNYYYSLLCLKHKQQSFIITNQRYRWKESQTDRVSDRQTDIHRETEKQRVRQKNRETVRQKYIDKLTDRNIQINRKAD